MTDPVRPTRETVGDAALQARTGRSRDEWFALLDAAGAGGWQHAAVARHLVDLGVDEWYAQSVTIAYEQARGKRVAGQGTDGTFQVSASVTVAASPAAIWPHLADAGLRAAWVDAPHEVTGQTEPRTSRWSLPDGGRVTVRLDPLDATRTRVAIQHTRVPSQEDLAPAKARWRAALTRLRTTLT